MALIKTIERGSNGWNKIIYTDGTIFEGYTDEVGNRISFGTLYSQDGSILAKGEWSGDNLIESMDELTFKKQINKLLRQTSI